MTYEITDSRSGSASPLKKIKEPSTFETFNYLYSYTGIFTGPYYTYRTYWDAYMTDFNVKNGDLFNMIRPKISTLAWSLPVLLLMNVLAPLKVGGLSLKNLNVF